MLNGLQIVNGACKSLSHCTPAHIFSCDFFGGMCGILVLELPGIAHAISGMRGGKLSGHSGPLFAPGECISARSGWTQSLSVLREYDQQRRTFRVAVCEECEGAAAGDGAERRARGVILSIGQLQ